MVRDMKLTKHILLLIISGVLAMGVVQSSAQAASKTGTDCKKLGAISISSGYKYTCIKSGKKLVWGKGLKVETKSTPTPTPIAIDSLVDCKLSVSDGRGDVSIGGWPRISDRMRSTGTVISQVVMVDFPDAPATMTPQAAFAKIAGAADTFKEVSYGKFTYTMQPTYKWYRMSKNSSEYTNGGWTFFGHRDYIAEATKLADADVDFSKSESFIILANPDAKGLGYSGPAFASIKGNGITLDGKYIANGATSAADLNNWGSIWANHELTHTMGLVDLYSFNPAQFNNNPFPFTGEFSYMGLSSFNSNSPGLLAFERWNVGWLDDSQVICSSAKEITQLITPIETIGGIKAVIVPLTATSALVIESRRAIGLDSKINKSGALVYLVDSSIQSGKGPVKIFPVDLATDPKFLKSPRALGESVSVEGWTVKVTSADASGDTVVITRN